MNNMVDNSAQAKMHQDEIDMDAALVRKLLAVQFPHLADRSIQLVRSTGTVNAIYRLGDDLYVRLPRAAAWARDVDREWTWLPKIAPHVSLQIPEPLAKGEPIPIYPYPWAIYRWIDGSPYDDDLILDECRAAGDLANFILELRRMDIQGAPRAGRKALIELDAQTRAAIQSSQGAIDIPGVTAAWWHALLAPAWDGQPLWIHADLLRSNLLVQDGRICAVIDFGGVGIGDPAADVVPAWSVFNPVGRAAFRQALDVDQATWERARGYALHQALLIIPYYAETNPEFVSQAKRTIQQILIDLN